MSNTARPQRVTGVTITLLAITSLIVAACDTSRPGAGRAATSAPIEVSSIPGVSAGCTAAFSEAARQEFGQLGASEAEGRIRDQIISILWACQTVAELEAAEAALPVLLRWGFDPGRGDVRTFCDAYTELTNAPICPLPTPEPTYEPTLEPSPSSVAIGDDVSFQTHSRELCQDARPSGLYKVSAAVKPLKDPAGRRGAYVLVVEYRDLDGKVGPLPKLKTGPVYDFDDLSPEPKFHVDIAADVDVVACLALRATDFEQWHFQSNPTHNYPIHACDTLVWMVDAKSGELVGLPWAESPGESGGYIWIGDGGPGIRRVDEAVIVADIEAFLGLE